MGYFHSEKNCRESKERRAHMREVMRREEEEELSEKVGDKKTRSIAVE